jgi:WhiB family redox-sensing transcriptional regulator
MPAWVTRGACDVVADPEIFWPERGGSSKAARAVCAQCSERIPCLTWALDNSETFGIWGGTTDRERRALRQAMARGGGSVKPNQGSGRRRRSGGGPTPPS